MNSKVAEDFILLSLNPKSGNYMIYGNYLNYGILGAIMMDLALGGRLIIDEKYMSANSQKGITGIEMHDRMYKQMLKASSPKRISTWIKRLSINSRWYLIQSRNYMVSRGIIRQEKNRFLFIPYKLHYSADPGYRSKLIYRLKDVLLYNKSPEESDLMLLGLVYSCKLHRALSDDRAERKSIRKNLVQMIKDRPITYGIDQAIREMQVAISAALAASVIASGASH